MDETWTINELVEQVERGIEMLPKPHNGQVRAVPDDRTVRYYATIGLLDRPVAMRGRTALYNRKHVAQVVAIKRLQATGRSLAEIQAMWPKLDDATLVRMTGIELAGVAAAKKAGRKDFWKEAPAPLPAPTSPSPTAPPPAKPAPSSPHTPAPRGGVPRDAAAPIGAPRDAAGTGRPRDAAAAIGAPRDAAASDSSTSGHPYRTAAPADLDLAYASGAYTVTDLPAAELRIELAPHISLSIDVSSDISISLADVAAIRAAAAPLIAELARRQLAVHAGEGEDV